MDVSELSYRSNVGLVVMNKQGAVFAAQRLDHYSDAWQMPQGGIDAGEAPLSAAYRELHEETGITREAVTLLAQTSDWLYYDLPEALIPKLWGGKYRGQKQKWFLMRFDGQDAQININTQTPEFSDWRWMPPETLIKYIVPFKRDIYRQVFDIFEPHLSQKSRNPFSH